MNNKKQLSREEVFKKIGFKHVTHTHKQGCVVINKNQKGPRWNTI